MGRSFNFVYQGRTLSIRPIAVDEGWELWVMEEGRRLACAGRVSVDESVAAARQGKDSIRIAAEEIQQHVLAAQLALNAPGVADP